MTPIPSCGEEQVKILIADDEESIANSYKLILESRNHKVVVSTDGEQCLHEFYEHQKAQKSSTRSSKTPPFDLVILDYRMPKKNGVEVAERILSAVPTQRIIIASAYNHELTGSKTIENLDQNIELLQKPFDFDIFLDVVEKGPAVPPSHGLWVSSYDASAIGITLNFGEIAQINDMLGAFETRR